MAIKKKQADPLTLPLSEQMSYFLIESEKTAERAKRGKRSLTGNNANAESFHGCRTQAIRAIREIQTALAPSPNSGLERTLADMEKELAYFFNAKTSAADRRDLRRHIEMLVKTEIEPALKSPKRTEAEFIPTEIVDNTRGYVVNVTRQVNRCFNCDSFDACAVMIRRLIETLIIEAFEKKGIASKIKDPANGNYFMFSDLVSKLINSSETPVGRTTKRDLPNIATVLNNSAHNRTFNISKSQLVQYQTAIVITVQELISLWDIRRS